MAVVVAVVVAVADGYESLDKDGMVFWVVPFLVVFHRETG